MNSQVRSIGPMPLELSRDAWWVYEVGWGMTRERGGFWGAGGKSLTGSA